MPVRFVLEQVYGAESRPLDAVLGSIGDVAVDDDQNVYLFDHSATRLVAFDRNGAVRWTAGQKGQGPGDLSDVVTLTFDGQGTLYVCNGDGTRIDLWSLDGGYLETLSLVDRDFPPRAWVAGFVRPNHLILSARRPRRLGSQVIVLNVSQMPAPVATPQFEVEAGPFDEPPTSSAAPSIEIRTGGGLILAGNLGAYSISAFDLSGRRIRTVTRPVDYLKLPATVTIGSRSSGRTFGFLSAPRALVGGYWLVQASWPTNVDDPTEAVRRTMTDPDFEISWASSLDLFDAKGRLLISMIEDGLRVSSIGRLALVDLEGRLYTVSQDPFPQVRRYRVEIDHLWSQQSQR